MTYKVLVNGKQGTTPEGRTKSHLQKDGAKVEVVERYSWYIENALRVRIKDMREQVDRAKATLASEENDGSAPYRSLEGMCSHVETALRDFQKAYDELIKAGVK